jgi:hypothetical protein
LGGEAKERKKLGVLGRRQGTTRELGLWGFDESQAKYIGFQKYAGTQLMMAGW